MISSADIPTYQIHCTTTQSSQMDRMERFQQLLISSIPSCVWAMIEEHELQTNLPSTPGQQTTLCQICFCYLSAPFLQRAPLGQTIASLCAKNCRPWISRLAKLTLCLHRLRMSGVSLQ